MNLPKRVAATALAAALVLGAAIAGAADHKEAPGTLADPGADLADVYAWHDLAGNRLVAVMTFAGLADSAVGPTYDANLLYTLNIDNTDDNLPDISVYCRFGQNDLGEWGVQVQNLPGASGTVVGRVDNVLDGGNSTKVFAGPREDPFFFDLDGFRQTLQTGTLSFSSSRDRFAGLNVTAIVLEMNLTSALGGASSLKLWATTGRKS
ncbi:MAG TPA: DUF4331 family protein [Candidatus Udaeobacter sp.]|nr:DUF4331 family protein [Candidatus Udaeobacter sp.]